MIITEHTALQRSVQLICPIIIGCAVSSTAIRSEHLRKFISLCYTTSMVIMAIVVIKTGILFVRKLPDVTGLAGEVMTVMLFCSLLAASFVVNGNRKDLLLWGAMAFIPVIALTRTAIVAGWLTLTLTFAPLKLWKRILSVVIFVVVAVMLFYTPRVQNKMFYSGSGTLMDIGDESKGFRSTGRFYYWKILQDGISQEPWLGHNTGATESLMRIKTGGISAYPHNDWLLTLYDYGYLGAGVYVICLLFSVKHAVSRARRSVSYETRLLLLTGASAFIPYAMLMYTDNIMTYGSYFGNLHFTVLGLGYAALAKENEQWSRQGCNQRVGDNLAKQTFL